jgi:hypothetical protein
MYVFRTERNKAKRYGFHSLEECFPNEVESDDKRKIPLEKGVHKK